MKGRNVVVGASLFILLVTAGAGLKSEPRVEEAQKDRVWHVVVDIIPSGLEEFRAFRDSLAKTPQGGIVAYLVAHLIMIDRPELGEQCLILTLDMSRLAKASGASRRPQVQGWQLGGAEIMLLQTSGFLQDRGYVAKSFVEGTKTSESYRLPPLPYKYVIRKHMLQDRNESSWMGHADTSCHDLGYVPIFVKRNDKGIWKVFNSSSFYSGCKNPPEAVSADDL
jgi:hypothetical protein